MPESPFFTKTGKGKKAEYQPCVLIRCVPSYQRNRSEAAAPVFTANIYPYPRGKNCRRNCFPSSLLTPVDVSPPACVPYSLLRLKALTSRCAVQAKVLSDLPFGDGELAEGAVPAQASWSPGSVDFSGKLAPPYLQGSLLSHERVSGRVMNPKEVSRIPS